MTEEQNKDAEPRNVQKAGVVQEITMEALESAAIDLRKFVRSDIDKKLDKFIGGGRSVAETKFREEQTTRTAGIYGENPDWDDPDLEPIGWEEIPMLTIIGTRLFVPESAT